MLAILAILVIIIGFFILGQGRRMQIETGLPAGRVVYADTGAWKTVERPLFSPLSRPICPLNWPAPAVFGAASTGRQAGLRGKAWPADHPH